MTTPPVDGALIWQHLEQLATISDDAPGDAGDGVTRLALTKSDAEGRRLVETWLRDAGCEVTHDPIGNTFGLLPGSEPDLPPVVMGSHTDTVVNAGRFDGCLGVVGAVEVLRAASQGPRPRRSLVAAVFTDEEGIRFGHDLLGSSVACGLLDPATALAAADQDGVTVEAELAAHGLPGDAPWLHQRPPHVYLETHVEQGPMLLRAGQPVGCVTGVVGTSWFEITLTGTATHAGATPMDMRRDAGLALADLRLALHEMTTRRPEITLAVGSMSLLPGVANVVPGQASMMVDLRSGDDDVLQAAERDLPDLAQAAAKRHGCDVERITRLSRTMPVTFDPALVDLVAASIDDDAGPPRLWSGAGHDAQQLATICPTVMIFVRSQHDGISHSPHEWSTAEDCALGVQAMARAAWRLAG